MCYCPLIWLRWLFWEILDTEAQLHSCLVISCHLNPEWLHQVQCGDGFRKFKTDGPSAVWVIHLDQLQVLQIFSIATLDEKSEVGWWCTGGSLFALLVSCGLSKSDLFWIKSEETRWYVTIFFTSALEAIVVLTAMGWCGKRNCSHFGSGGHCSFDCNGLVWETQLQPFWLWWPL